MDKMPMVTVLCLTFNQVKYVEAMLEGVVNQITNFDYEVIIHDDASTDGTAIILHEYEKKYPELIKVIYEKENQWSKGVKITQKNLMPLVTGKYVAFCEGDDFWIDHNKLQEQVDFLEGHLDYVCVAHNALCMDIKDNKIYSLNNFETSRDVHEWEIIDRQFPFLATASKIYRRNAFTLNGFFLECGEVGDMCTEYNAILQGKFYYIDKIMSVYRCASEGSWTVRAQKSEYSLKFRAKFLRFMKLYNDYTKGKYQYYIECFMSRGVAYLCDQLLRENIAQDEFNARINSFNVESKGQYDVWLKKIEYIVNLRVYSHNPAFANELVELSKDKDIYIYGAGDFGIKMANQMLNSNIPFQGFLVSSMGNNPEKLFGKNVYEIENYVEKIRSAIIVIAMDITKWGDVKTLLQKYNINSYCCPFYVSLK